MLNKVSPQSMADEHLLPAALLEMGDSLNFIEVRKHTLRKEIKDSKLSAAAGKFSGLGAIVGGVALAALSNPLGWLIGGCGLTAYTLSVFGQWLQTGKVHPMPLSSKSQDERDEDLAGQTVSGDGGNSTGRTAIHEEAAYLSDREKTEYELLHFAPQGLMSAMNNVPPAQRWACYQFLVDAFAAGTIGDYANPQTLKDVLGNPSIYSSHLPEASKRFPQYGLPLSESLSSATSSVTGNQTQLGTIAPLYPTDEEIQAIGNTLIDRLKVAERFAAVEQIGQRVKAGDIKGGLKMAISANGLNATSFLDAFPGNGHVFDWANDAMAAVIPTTEKEQTIADYIETTKPSDRDVEGAVQTARSQPTAQSPDSSQWAKPSAIAINPISVIGNTLSSLLLIAPTGAGKGILVSNLIRHFHKSYTGLKVFAFEGKNDQNETGYWSEGFEQVARVNLDICDAIEAARAISWVVSQVDQSHGYGSPSILLVDEANTLITVLENGAKYGLREDKEECGIALGLIKKKISTAASTGNSAQKYVWVIGQNPNLTALGLNGGDANQLRKVAIALYSNPVLTDQITLNTGYTGKKQDASYRSVIDDLIECSPVDRAFYDSASAQTTKNKGWFPMDEMINYSGYDRDSRKHIGKTRQANTVATALSNQECEEAESNESYTMPEDPSDRVKLAAKLVQESGAASPDEIDELVPGLSKYLPTVVLFYSECTRRGEVYTWAS